MSSFSEISKQVLSRIGYGFSQSELERFNKLGLEKYIEEQLNPKEEEDLLLNEKLQNFSYEAEYNVKENNKTRKVKEIVKLKYPNANLDAILPLYTQPHTYDERVFPAREVRIATWLRMMYSKWQLKEVLVEFWHNHFNVNVETDERIGSLFPIYDREVIRKHCFGNFRELLEAVAKNPCMLYYLDNFNSKASPANENYARELFELHTLGADNYLNNLYNRWKNVPGALEGKPVGYIDEDVYEAARAFTGWTVADGSNDEKGGKFPLTGEFHYYEGGHDNYQKRVLGVEFEPNQPPLADGLKVLDLLAYHPGTSKFICTKLCRRLVADEPEASLIEKAVKTWESNQKSPDQIKKTIKTILLSEEFKKSLGKKIKRPLELVASFLKNTEAELSPTNTLHYLLSQMGYRQFTWVTPTGHPDREDYWLNSNMMLLRWKVLPVLLMQNWHKLTNFNLDAQLPPEAKTCIQIVDFWINKILGNPVSENTRRRLLGFFTAGGVEEEIPLGSAEEIKQRMMVLIVLIGSSAEFQYR